VAVGDTVNVVMFVLFLDWVIQYRKGPNKPRLIALTIPIADAIKLFTKEEK